MRDTSSTGSIKRDCLIVQTRHAVCPDFSPGAYCRRIQIIYTHDLCFARYVVCACEIQQKAILITLMVRLL